MHGIGPTALCFSKKYVHIYFLNSHKCFRREITPNFLQKKAKTELKPDLGMEVTNRSPPRQLQEERLGPGASDSTHTHARTCTYTCTHSCTYTQIQILNRERTLTWMLNLTGAQCAPLLTGPWPLSSPQPQGSARTMFLSTSDAGGDDDEASGTALGTLRVHKLTDCSHQLYKAALVLILWMRKPRHRKRFTDVPRRHQDAAASVLAQSCAGPGQRSGAGAQSCCTLAGAAGLFHRGRDWVSGDSEGCSAGN